MDSTIDTSSLSKLSEKDKKELQQFLTNESQKSRIQQAVHNMTDTCFKKCFTSSSMKGTTLTSSEDDCTRNCVNRFLDGSESIIRELERHRAEGI